MQTFVPDGASYRASASCLDSKRLGKQLVEVQQIYTAIVNPAYGWQHHPAVRMWRGRVWALLSYGMAVYDEWWGRKRKQHKSGEFIEARFYERIYDDAPKYPSWWGGPVHSTHRAVLLAKDPEWYGRFAWKESPAEKVNGKWPYEWPEEKSND